MHNITAAINRNECDAHTHKHTIIILYIDKVWQLFKSITVELVYSTRGEKRGRERGKRGEREREYGEEIEGESCGDF